MNRHLKTPITALATLGLLLGLAACQRQPQAEIPVRPVKLQTVGGAEATGQLELAGEVRARVESRLGFRVGGKIISRSVEAGQRVKRGQELARLDGRDFDLAQSSAQSRQMAAQADLDVARAEYRRLEELHKKGFISDLDLEKKRVAVAGAEAQLAQAKSGSALEGNRLNDTVLRADADGVITQVNADTGEVVAAGQAVVQLAQDGPREIAVEFPEDRTGLAHAPKVEVMLWAKPEARFPASLRELAASADPVTRTFRARYSVQAPSGLLALGQSATLLLTFPTPTSSSVTLPTTALLESKGQTSVWLYDSKTQTVKRQAVQVAGISGNDVLLQGLPAGAQVVVAGVHILNEGQKVRPLAAGTH